MNRWYGSLVALIAVATLGDLRLGDLASLGRIVPCRRRIAGVVLDDLGRARGIVRRANRQGRLMRRQATAAVGTAHATPVPFSPQ